MKKTTLIIVMAALCLNFNLKAQEPTKPPPLKNQTILGKVIAATTGEAISGAIVTVRGTRHTVHTIDRGEFILSLPNGSHNLSVSHLSYKTKTLSIQVPLKEQLTIALENENNALDEIQIIGYGQTGTGGGSPLNYINPADIDRINTLKDADATWTENRWTYRR